MATPSSESGTGSAREEAERLVAAVLARASQGASQAAWMAQGAKFAARASGHETTSTGLGLLGDALRGVAKTASGFSEDLHKHSEGTTGARTTARPPTNPASTSGPASTTTATPRVTEPAAPGTRPAAPGPVPDDDGRSGRPQGDGADSGRPQGDRADSGRPQGDRADSGRPWDDGVRDEHVFEPAGPAAHAGWATGSAECCVCPVCRAITMVRNPTPEFAEQLATSAGDLAAGVAGLLRAFSTAAADPTTWSGPARSGAASTGAASTGAAGAASAGAASAGAAGAASGGAASTGAAGAASAGAASGGAASGGAASGGAASGGAGAEGAAKPAKRAPHEDSGTGWPREDPWSAATRAETPAQPAGDPWSAATRDSATRDSAARAASVTRDSATREASAARDSATREASAGRDAGSGDGGGHPGSSGAAGTGDHERESGDTV